MSKSKKLPNKVSRHGSLYIRGDFAQASSSISFAWSREDVDNDRWNGSPFQVADARHSRLAAAKLIRNWGN